MTRQSSVLIIGGGISGLSTAWWLSQHGIHSILLEQAKRSGGLIDSTDQDGYLTDHAASMILNFDSNVGRFISESGLQKHRVNRNPVAKRYVLKNSELAEVPVNIREMLCSDLFSLKTRIQMITEAFRCCRRSEWESVAAFIRRRLGQEILDLAIDPYVSAVLACDPEKACARSTLPRLTALENEFGSITAGVLIKKLLPGKRGLPQEAFSFSGGMKTLVDTLAENPLAEIHTGQQVIALEPLKSGWRVTASDNTTELQYQTRHVIFSTPANIACELLKPIHPKLSALLNQIEYAPIAQIHLGFDRDAFSKPLDGSGFLVPSREKTPIRGSLWISNLIANRAPEGKLLTSNFIGGACQADSLKNPDRVLVDQTLSALQNLCGLKGSPEMIRINRHHQGLPLYHGNYHRLTQAINQYEGRCDGLHFVANYLQGISIRDRIIQAKTVADQISTRMTEGTTSSPAYVWTNADEVLNRV
ncbi:MAG: protoporphyrinogen oxidase [Gammaproteobacteria bacterium]